MDNIFTNEVILTFALRVILGIMFLVQGYDKLFNIGMDGVVRTVNNQYLDKGFPMWLVTIISYLTTYIEFLAGLMLVLGLFKTIAFYLLLLDIGIVSLGMSILVPLWDMRYIWPRLALLTVLMLLPDSWDILSVDHLRMMINE